MCFNDFFVHSFDEIKYITNLKFSVDLPVAKLEAVDIVLVALRQNSDRVSRPLFSVNLKQILALEA